MVELTEQTKEAAVFGGAAVIGQSQIPESVKEEVSIAALGGAAGTASQQIDSATKLKVTQAAIGIPAIQSDYTQDISAKAQGEGVDKMNATLERAFQIIQNGELTDIEPPQTRNAGQHIIAQLNGDAGRETQEAEAKTAANQIKSWVNRVSKEESQAVTSGVGGRG